MDGNAVSPVWSREVGAHIRFHLLTRGGLVDGQQIEHEFGDGEGRGKIGRVDVGGVGRGDDIVAVAMFGPKHIGDLAQFESMAEEVMDHVHTTALAILQNDDRDAGGRHPGDETFEMREPLVRRNIVQGQ